MSKFPKYASKSLQEFMDEITDNKRLQAALCYSFGDYGMSFLFMYPIFTTDYKRKIYLTPEAVKSADPNGENNINR